MLADEFITAIPSRTADKATFPCDNSIKGDVTFDTSRINLHSDISKCTRDPPQRSRQFAAFGLAKSTARAVARDTNVVVTILSKNWMVVTKRRG